MFFSLRVKRKSVLVTPAVLCFAFVYKILHNASWFHWRVVERAKKRPGPSTCEVVDGPGLFTWYFGVQSNVAVA